MVLELGKGAPIQTAQQRGSLAHSSDCPDLIPGCTPFSQLCGPGLVNVPLSLPLKQEEMKPSGAEDDQEAQ